MWSAQFEADPGAFSSALKSRTPHSEFLHDSNALLHIFYLLTELLYTFYHSLLPKGGKACPWLEVFPRRPALNQIKNRKLSEQMNYCTSRPVSVFRAAPMPRSSHEISGVLMHLNCCATSFQAYFVCRLSEWNSGGFYWLSVKVRRSHHLNDLDAAQSKP